MGRVVTAVALLISVLQAQAVAFDSVGEALKRFERVKSPIADDANSVVIFFAFSCPHCAQVVPYLLEWADTLPKGVRVRFSPVMVGESRDVLRYVHGFMVCEHVVSSFKECSELVMEFFTAAQSGRVIPDEDIIQMLMKWGANPERLRGLWYSEPIRAEMMRALKDFEQYGVGVVPSVGIAGRYVVTPDDLPPMPDEGAFVSLFIELLNGFVSRMVEGMAK